MTAATTSCASCSAWILADPAPSRCPACGSPDVASAGPGEGRAPPEAERRVPRAVDAAAARARVAAAAAQVWFPAPDLARAAQPDRLVAVWWPHWLVDVDAVGIFQAEVGFDEAVQSSQEVFDGGRWTTRAVTETRTRWEPRVGRLRRRYDNLVVPALARAPSEGVDLSASEACAGAVDGAVVLPDRTTAEQWPAVLAALRERVTDEVARACGAAHARDTFLDVDADGAHWTLLLVPGWATWYADDEGVVRLLTVHGATGEVRGPRLASPAAGRRAAWGWFGAGGAIAAAGVALAAIGLVVWVLLPVAGLVVLGGAVVAMVGLWPLVAPAAHNRAELGPAGG